MTPLSQDTTRGICLCGCGRATNIITRTSRLKSAGRVILYKRGEYYQYCAGHANRIIPVLEDATPFKIDGVYCRLIHLTRGQVSIVDASDYEWLMQWKWHATKIPKTGGFYANRTALVNGRRVTVPMHRLILCGIHSPHIDHWNHVTLDNRRKNLRPATRSQNNQNSGPTIVNKSGYKGVCLQSPPTKPWIGKVAGKQIGRFRTAEEAARAVDKKALEIYGEFAYLNFPK